MNQSAPETDPLLPNRRAFLKTSTLAIGGLSTVAVTGPASPVAQAAEGTNATPAPSSSPPPYPIIGFTKPFQKFTADQTADLVSRVGWDGIECPVRAKGQIEPEKVADDLPSFLEVMRRRKLEVSLVATDITSMKTPHAERVLRALARANIKRLRLGFFRYPNEGSPTQHLKELGAALRDIAAACQDLGLQAGFQNHSGHQFVGAPVWDVYSLIHDLNPKHIGYCFDIGHATLEGGLSWPLQARLAEPFLTAVLVKDFYWQRENGSWNDTWCPLGEGMVQRRFFEWLKNTGYRGPICQHHEYPLGDRKLMMAHFKHDLKILKEWLA
jgi:sugar phosphate isomerase/epimerase